MKNILTSFIIAASAAVAAASSPSGNPVMGYLGYSDSDNYEAGLYSVGPEGATRIWPDQLYTTAGLSLNSGWYRNGRVCGFYPFYYLGQLISIIYAETDLDSGQVVEFIDRDIHEGAFEVATYNPDDDCIYGYGFDASGKWLFMKAPADTPFETETIKPIPSSGESQICSSLTYSAHDRMLYGVNAESRLVSIAPNGNQEPVMQLSPYNCRYITGLWRNDADGRYWWNAILREPGSLSDVSYIVAADPKSSAVSEIYEFENGEEFMFFFQKEYRPDAETPAAPGQLTATPAGASSETAVYFVLPAATVGGTPLTGLTDWRMLVDGCQVQSGQAAPSSAVNTSLDGIADGLHQLTVYASLPGGKESDAAMTLFYIGADTPATPRNISMAPTGVSWEAVATGEHGGYVDPASISYDLWINGAFETTTSSTSHPLNLPTTGPMQSFTAKVVAKYGGRESKPGYSNTLVVGDALRLPAHIVPTAEQASLCDVADEDGDGFTWTYDQATSSFASTYNEDFPTDDWLFLPPMSFDSSEVYYRLSLTASCLAPEYRDEYLEASWGTAPAAEGMSRVIMSRFQPDPKDPTLYSAYFTIPAPGNGYIGLHAVSYPDQYGMSVRDIRVERTGITPASPAAPELEEIGDLTGGKVTITLKLPTKTVGGDDLAADASLECRLACGPSTAAVAGRPGEIVSATIPVASGWNEISASVWLGELEGLPASFRKYVGEDVPATVGNLTVVPSRDMMGATMSWDAPQTGFNGGTIDPNRTNFQIFAYLPVEGKYVWQLLDETTRTSYTWRAQTGMEQMLIQLGVLARNATGDSGRIAAETIYVGTPYDIPADEDFEDLPNLSFSPYIIYTPNGDYAAEWGFGNFEDYLGFGDGNGIIADTSVSGTRGRLGLPRFSTLGMENVSVSFGLYAGSDAAEVSILAETYDEDIPAVVATSAGLSGWGPLTFDLDSEYLNQPWVQLYVEALFPSRLSVVAISDISISGSSGVGLLPTADGLMIKGLRNGVVLESKERNHVRIMSPSGLTIADFDLEGKRFIPLQHGLYFVNRRKLFVK